jgi:hypothetical protein
MSRLVQDVRYALRTFVRGRFVTVLAVLAFGLGIGVTTAVFSIFNSVLLTPLPYPDSEELVVVYDTQPACTTCPASFPKYHDWRERNHVFAAIGRLALGADPRKVRILVVQRGLIVALAGIALGAAGAFFLRRTLQTMLNDVKPTDPVVFAASAIKIGMVSLLACYLPARSAGRVDPIVVLRGES